ncbi:hypothetical protein CC86DRAFT_150390 [Ophiobolus disseminans]|uniref:Uncharacterized protein n=1 Tax=Ophiobolus disseminans TaxID=1469910 RepID=A0A6A6ZFT5_9PLEO|nr:hypothetical protein CC86DRAFT_150390 [Ophiobolus disseminans]
MDLRPRRTPSPPARPAHNAPTGAVWKRPAAGRTALPNPLPPAARPLNSSPAVNGKLPAGRAAAAVTAVQQTQRVECWIYREGGRGGAAQESSSESGAIAREDIARWLRQPPRKSLVDDKAPVAGLRLICRRQHVSMERPFDGPTLRAIHSALGLSEGHNYLTTLKAGACGKYIAGPGNPSEFFRLVSPPHPLQQYEGARIW